MSDSTPGAWTVFDRETPVLTYTYSFGVGTANALAVGGPSGLLVLSPPYRTAPSAFDDLAQYGEVRALIATNAFHHLGLPEWKARFPAASVFAPAQSIARVREKSGIAAVEPVSAAAAIAGPRVTFVDMPYYRTGEVLVRLNSARGLAWYVTDLILNVRKLPRNPLVSLLARMTGSVPGLRWNKIGPTLMVRDKHALRRWIREEFDREPPRWLIPTHGEVLDVQAEHDAVQKLFGRIR